MNIFPEKVLTKAELDIVTANLTHPTVQEYLRTLAYHTGAILVTYMGEKGLSNEELINRQRFEQGKLACLETLLSIRAESIKLPGQLSN